MPNTVLRYRWRYFDTIRKKNCTTRYHATEDEIRREHPDAVAVLGSEQLMELPDDPLVNSAAHIQNSR